MFINNLRLENFRTYSSAQFSPSKGINIFIGSNGIGKTNILEAIYFLSNLSSHRQAHRSALIKQTPSIGNSPDINSILESALISAEVFSDNSEKKIGLRMQIAKSKVLAKVDDNKVVSAHKSLGIVRSIFFSPASSLLISEDPKLRRDFLDSALLQINPEYANLLFEFKTVHKQRVAIIKSSFQSVIVQKKPVDSNFEIWTEKFQNLANEIQNLRAEFISQIEPIVNSKFQEISNSDQKAIRMQYIPSEFDLESGTKPEFYFKEIARGVNLFGPTRDEIAFFIGDFPAKGFASSGEQWTLALALQLALHQILSTGETAILLLDDIFSELDDEHRFQIAQLLETDAQVFLTCASKNDIPRNLNAKYFNVTDGQIEEEKC